MSRHDGSTMMQTPSPNEQVPDRQASYCLGDKLAHRALGEARPRSSLPALSAEARDLFYARMFPSHICLGAPLLPLIDGK